ncbi:ABC transporter permease [Candidatus Bathycorpusculum sp.]|jgi:ABC-2 type transport system permease protein|uniref:ABC transporter permease n=1 Tax=Candidatus Bathycorpusculum sp. TaxID=2994959 RepID=UPI002816BAA7|nr:ABC transporter permease [Candidatus Termitimicrobium sp.]
MVSARRIYADFRVFSVGYLRNKFGLFFGLIFPVVLILIFGAIFAGGGAETVDVYAQNQDNGVFGQNIGNSFLSALNQSSTIRVITVDSSENFADFLAAKSASDGILIPPDFSAQYIEGNQVNITVYGNPASSTSGIVSGTVSGYVSHFNLQRFNGTTVIGLTTTTINTQQTNYVDFLIPGLIGFSILTSPMFSLVNISSDYKKNKLFKQLSLTPLTKMEWLISKVLFYILLSAAGFLLMSGVGILIFNAHITFSLWLIPFLVLGPILFASLGMLVGSVTKSPETAGVIGNIITFPMMFLAGTFFPLSIMPSYLQTIAHVLPLFYVTEGLNNVMVYNNIPAAMFDIAILGIITLVIFVLAVKLFKWRED